MTDKIQKRILLTSFLAIPTILLCMFVIYPTVKLMKKLVLMAVAIVAVSFASCGNKAADAAKATADSIRIADSIAAVEAAALEAEQAAAAAADSLNADSTATETVAE